MQNLTDYQQWLISVYLVGYFDTDNLSDALHLFYMEMTNKEGFAEIEQAVINGLLSYEDMTGLLATEREFLMLLRLLAQTGNVTQSIDILCCESV